MTKTRSTATSEDILWEMDKKTAALKRIHAIANEWLDNDNGDGWELIKRIRYIAGAHYPAMEPEVGDRLEIKAL